MAWGSATDAADADFSANRSHDIFSYLIMYHNIKIGQQNAPCC